MDIPSNKPLFYVFIGDAGSGKNHLAKSALFKDFTHYDCDTSTEIERLWEECAMFSKPCILTMKNLKPMSWMIHPWIDAWFLFRNGALWNQNSPDTSKLSQGMYIYVPVIRNQEEKQSPSKKFKPACKLCNEDHEMFETEKDHDSDNEEWSRHTSEYQDAYDHYFEQLSEQNSIAGEMLMSNWEKCNHPKLCCNNRHQCKF